MRGQRTVALESRASAELKQMLLIQWDCRRKENKAGVDERTTKETKDFLHSLKEADASIGAPRAIMKAHSRREHSVVSFVDQKIKGMNFCARPGFERRLGVTEDVKSRVTETRRVGAALPSARRCDEQCISA
jgi:hypothetical protein